ncbi:hypothetical protein ScPMuIL_003165 [Solemya velum]
MPATTSPLPNRLGCVWGVLLCVVSSGSSGTCNTLLDIVVWAVPGQYVKGGNSFWKYAIRCGGKSNHTLNASMAVGPGSVTASSVTLKPQSVHLNMTIETGKTTSVVIGDKIQLRIKDTNSMDFVNPQTCSAVSTDDAQRPVEIWSYSSCSKRPDLIDSNWTVGSKSDISIYMYAFHFIGEQTLTISCDVSVCSGNTCHQFDPTQCGTSNSQRRRRRELSSGARKKTKQLMATITISDLPYTSGTDGGGSSPWKAMILVLVASVAFRLTQMNQ